MTMAKVGLAQVGFDRREAAERVSSMVVFLKHASETEDAQYCQPCFHSPGSLVGSGGLFPWRSSDQLGLPPKPSRVELRTGCFKFCHAPTFWDLLLPLHGPHHHVRDSWVSLCDHGAVRPPTMPSKQQRHSGLPISSRGPPILMGRVSIARANWRSSQLVGDLLEEGVHGFPQMPLSCSLA